MAWEFQGKTVIVEGKWGRKPTEACECTIILTEDCLESKLWVLGDAVGPFERAVENCLETMHEGEQAMFTFSNPGKIVTIHLVQFIENGLVYEWNPQKKLNLALNRKTKGVELFRANDNKEAAYKFSKALKILCTIPVDAENPPTIIDSIPLKEINKIKASLYNNLSSCYFRNNCWVLVIELCKKVFIFDGDNNVKALYKIGVAYRKEKDFDNARKVFERVLDIEPQNKAALEQLGLVRSESKLIEQEFSTLCKKMFKNTIGE